jgi:hypothetical protein
VPLLAGTVRSAEQGVDQDDAGQDDCFRNDKNEVGPG